MAELKQNGYLSIKPYKHESIMREIHHARVKTSADFFYLSVGSLGAYRYTCVMVFCKDKVRLKSSTFLFTAHVLSWEGMIRYLQKNGMVKSTREIIDFIELFFRKARK